MMACYTQYATATATAAKGWTPMKTALRCALILCTFLTIAACGEEPSPVVFTGLRGDVPVLDPATVEPAVIEQAAQSQRAFAVGLYHELLATESGKNLVVSPFSIFSAFNLLYPGADAPEAELMRQGFHLTGTDQEILDGQGALYLSLLGRSTPAARIEMANALFVGEQFQLRQAYLDAVTRSYDATSYVVDFVNDYENVRRDINRWVEDHTAGKITNLFPPASIHKGTDMVLVNAVYFNAKWKYEFEDGDPLTFRGKAGDKVLTPMYLRMEASPYGEGPIDGVPDSLVQVLPLPYQDDRFDMVLLLPSDFDAFTASLTADALDRYLELGYTPPVNAEQLAFVKVPAFQISWDIQLHESVMPALGLGGLLCTAVPRPQFLGLFDFPTCVGGVFHKAFIDVNKQGTEAAAATGIAMNDTGNSDTPRYIYFTADRPFVYAIVERATRTVLFLGHVVNL